MVYKHLAMCSYGLFATKDIMLYTNGIANEQKENSMSINIEDKIENMFGPSWTIYGPNSVRQVVDTIIEDSEALIAKLKAELVMRKETLDGMYEMQRYLEGVE